MHFTKRLVSGLILSLFSVVVTAAGSISVEHDQMIESAAGVVWEKAGDFGGIHVWHPAIASTEVKGDGKTAGDTRLLTLGDGATLSELLQAYDESTMSMSYAITESPLPIKDYESTLTVEKISDTQSRVKWVSTFNSNGVSDEEAAGIIKGIYEAGLTELAGMF